MLAFLRLQSPLIPYWRSPGDCPYLNLGVHWEVSKFGTESVRSGICGFLRIVLRVCQICTARPNLGPVRRLQPVAAGASAGLRTKFFFLEIRLQRPKLVLNFDEILTKPDDPHAWPRAAILAWCRSPCWCWRMRMRVRCSLCEVLAV